MGIYLGGAENCPPQPHTSPMMALRDSEVDPHLLMETGTQKDKWRHVKMFKTLFEQKLIPLSQGQTKGQRRAQGMDTEEVLKQRKETI